MKYVKNHYFFRFIPKLEEIVDISFAKFDRI